MKILAIDSTALVCSVCVCDDENILSSFTVNNGNTHSETLLPMVEVSLKLLGITADDVDLFALSEGPGSFTGVRIGAATVKGLAFGKDKPCVGVSTLEALAYNMIAYDGIICPVMNARRNQVYNAVYRSKDSRLEVLAGDRAISAGELEDELSAYDEPIFLVGDGDFMFGGSEKIKYARVPETLRMQDAYSVAQCALKKYKNGDATTDTYLAPTYLRPSQAERERNEKTKEK